MLSLNSSHISLAAASLAVFIWVISIAVIKGVLYELNFFFYLFIRFGSTSLILALPLYKALKKRVKLKRYFIVLFLCSAALHVPLQTLAIKVSSISWYISFMAFSPLCVTIFSGILNKHTFFTLIIGIIGVLCFTNPSELNTFPHIYEIAALLASLGTWTLLTTLIKKINFTYSDLEIASLVSFGGFLGSFIIFTSQRFPFQALNLTLSIKLLFLIIGSPVAYWLFSFGIRSNPFMAIMSQYMEFIFGILIGFFWFQESHLIIQWIGCFFIFVSLILTQNIKK
ncbi:MAG: DMT family transporter [Alphaproteobacteria bacterium]|nr:DMT family transporter [Alphaproteobacteria bacterium]